jgi:hypothetical protein
MLESPGTSGSHPVEGTNMDSDRQYRSGRVPLPGHGNPVDGPGPADPAGQPDASARRDGIRHVRRVSNWTAAALVVGTGAAVVALSHQAFTPAAPAAGTASSATSGAGTTSASAHGATGPSATHSVATTSGSGVTVTTTTHTVNGKTIVTHVRHVPAYHDN